MAVAYLLPGISRGELRHRAGRGAGARAGQRGHPADPDPAHAAGDAAHAGPVHLRDQRAAVLVRRLVHHRLRGGRLLVGRDRRHRLQRRFLGAVGTAARRSSAEGQAARPRERGAAVRHHAAARRHPRGDAVRDGGRQAGRAPRAAAARRRGGLRHPGRIRAHRRAAPVRLHRHRRSAQLCVAARCAHRQADDRLQVRRRPGRGRLARLAGRGRARHGVGFFSIVGRPDFRRALRAAAVAGDPPRRGAPGGLHRGRRRDRRAPYRRAQRSRAPARQGHRGLRLLHLADRLPRRRQHPPARRLRARLPRRRRRSRGASCSASRRSGARRPWSS